MHHDVLAWMPGYNLTARVGIIWWHFSLKCLVVDTGTLAGAIDVGNYLGLSLLSGCSPRMAASGHLDLPFVSSFKKIIILCQLLL